MKMILMLTSVLWTGLAFAESATTENDIGQQLYTQACQTCHSPAVAEGLNAPAAFDEKAWSERIVAAKKAAEQDPNFESANDYLVYQVRIGKGLMQHSGLCLEAAGDSKTCSDKAFIAAIEYMSRAK